VGTVYSERPRLDSGHVVLPSRLIPPRPSLVWGPGLVRDVFSRPSVNSVKQLNRYSVDRVAQVVAGLLDNVVRGDKDSRSEAMCRLLLFPRAVLANVPQESLSMMRKRNRNSAQRNFTSEMLDAWVAGAASRDDLIEGVLSSAPRARVGGSYTVAARHGRCRRLASEEGRYGKAVEALRSLGPAPLNEETLGCLRDLHPVSLLPTRASVLPTTGPESFSEEHVMRQLRSFPKGTACGRSGWRAEHLLQCSNHPYWGPGFRKSLTAVVNWLAGGHADVDFAPLLSSAPLTPLAKKGGGIRPIAVGEIFRRLVSKCCMASVKVAASLMLSPLQLGVGVQNGVEAILHSLNDVACSPHTRDSVAFLLVDFKNAFNMVSRDWMFREVRDHFPSLSPWVEFTYGCSSHLFVGEDSIFSTSGVQQGDPLGPLLFALVLHPILLKIRDSTDVTLAAYLDDLSLVGRPEHVRAALSILEEDCSNRGLHISSAKSCLWRPAGDSVAARLRDVAIRDLFPGLQLIDDSGVELLGGSLSSDGVFVRRILDKRLDKCFDSMDLVLELNDPQLALLLFRSCEGMKKLPYSWRTSKPWLIGPSVARAREKTFAALRQLVVSDGPGFSEFSYELATLPVSLGGLGVLCPQDVSAYAYAGSWKDSMVLQSRILGSLVVPPPEFRERFDSYFPHVDLDTHPSSYSSSNSAEPPLYSSLLAREFYDDKRRRVLEGFFRFSPRKLVKKDLAFSVLCKSMMYPGSGAWLFAMPNVAYGQRMTPIEFRAAVALRLMIPMFQEGGVCKLCHQPMDTFGHHSMVCSSGGAFKRRHDLVRDALYGLAWYAQLRPEKDAAVQCLGVDVRGKQHMFRPADLLVNGSGFPRTCIDVTVVSPIKQSALAAGRSFGHAVQLAEDAKYEKHRDACYMAGYGFKAFAVDTFGILAKSSAVLLSRLFKLVAVGRGLKLSLAAKICRERINFAVTLAVARQLVACKDEDVFM